jgi:hypothetical protein
MLLMNETSPYDLRHGGPYDCGAADSYYGRGFDPHYFVGDSHNTPRIGLEDMTTPEIVDYIMGFANNEASGDKKDY